MATRRLLSGPQHVNNIMHNRWAIVDCKSAEKHVKTNHYIYIDTDDTLTPTIAHTNTNAKPVPPPTTNSFCYDIRRTIIPSRYFAHYFALLSSLRLGPQLALICFERFTTHCTDGMLVVSPALWTVVELRCLEEPAPETASLQSRQSIGQLNGN